MNRALRFRRRLGGVSAAVVLILLLAFYFTWPNSEESVEMSGWAAYMAGSNGTSGESR